MLRRKWRAIKTIVSLLMIATLFKGCFNMTDFSDSILNSTKEVISSAASNIKDAFNGNADTLTVHYIDVGQGDCTLLSCGGEYMLIDAGDNTKGTVVQNYLTKQGVTSIKYVIATHPDADHIGGMDVIVTKFDCQTILKPDKSADTKTYSDFISAMKYKNYESKCPQIGQSYNLGTATFIIIAPNRSYDDTNESSIAVLVKNGNNKFLFTGDCGEEAENDILANGIDISNIDVYKVGHHGSKYSSSDDFMNTIKPKYAVISCGAGNDYGHPHARTLNILRDMSVSVFRTDEQGTIIATSDGTNITFNMQPSTSWQAGEK